jgi:hypothetical protein
MSSSSLPRSVQLEWYTVRDFLLGHNNRPLKISTALKLASSSSHPESRWLAGVLKGKEITRKKQARDFFASLVKDGRFMGPCGELSEAHCRALCLCFSCLLGGVSMEPLLESVSLGYAFAQATLAGVTPDETCVGLAELACEQGERDGGFCCICLCLLMFFRHQKGFYNLGLFLQNGDGCVPDFERSKEMHLKAAELNHASAFSSLGMMCEGLERWFYWGRAGSLGNFVALNKFFKWTEHEENFSLLFTIGKGLHKGWVKDFSKFFQSGNRLVQLYLSQIENVKAGVRTWSLVGIRFGVVKDIRVLIAKMVWDSRACVKCQHLN